MSDVINTSYKRKHMKKGRFYNKKASLKEN